MKDKYAVLHQSLAAKYGTTSDVIREVRLYLLGRGYNRNRLVDRLTRANHNRQRDLVFMERAVETAKRNPKSRYAKKLQATMEAIEYSKKKIAFREEILGFLERISLKDLENILISPA